MNHVRDLMRPSDGRSLQARRPDLPDLREMGEHTKARRPRAIEDAIDVSASEFCRPTIEKRLLRRNLHLDGGFTTIVIEQDAPRSIECLPALQLACGIVGRRLRSDKAGTNDQQARRQAAFVVDHDGNPVGTGERVAIGRTSTSYVYSFTPPPALPARPVR